jgi:hypothetical protein
VKNLRSDGGGEYKSKEFVNFCKSQEIIMQTTARYTPQKNGVAERKNQTIMNMARSLLREKCLSNLFWVEAVACLVYLLNRSPTTSLKMKVPQESWSGTKLNVSHLRTFGCIAFAHIPSELRKKLNDRSEKRIFVGYSETSKAYRLYNLISKKLILVEMSNFLKISSGVSLKIDLWTVKIHCCHFLKTQKIQDRKHISLPFQDYRYKDSLKVLRTTLLQVEIHPMNFKIRELEV